VEKARADGLNVEMAVVADDCALPRNKGITGRRGVAGTVFVSSARPIVRGGEN
jgi:dihydroxyacetone kinase